MQDILIGILEQGFIYGILALGVYITYRILDFPDLSDNYHHTPLFLLCNHEQLLLSALR